MNVLIYVLFVLVLLIVDFLPSGLKVMPRSIGYSVDLLALMICVGMGVRLVGQRRAAITPRYLVLVVLYVITLAVSVILNWVRVEPLIAGIRFHLKYLPFFLLPMVFEFSGKEVERQLRFVFGFLLLQPLIVFLQRFVFLRHAHADFMTGTLGGPSHLCLVLICSIAVVFAFYLRGLITLRRCLIVAAWLMLPAAVNETKSTLVFFPLALALPAFFLPRIWASAKIKNLFTVGIVLVLVGTTFAVIFQQSQGYSVFEKYENEIEGQGYLFTGSHGEVREKKVGRGDALLLALTDLSKDVGGLLFGLGAGNVIPIGARWFRGDYMEAKSRYEGEMMTLTHLLWELGLAGVFIYMAFLVFLFRDALFLAKSPDVFGILSLGFTAVVAIIFISLIYKNIIYFHALYVLFWYFSGVIAAKAYRLRGLVRTCEDLRANHPDFQHLSRADAVAAPASCGNPHGLMDWRR
jgi:hypothetical protein